MAQITVAPLVMKDVLLTIGSDSYEYHVSGVTFTPANSAVEWRGLNPNAVFTDPGSVTWSLALNYVQDWTTADSLSRFLFENSGTTVDMTFKPQSGSGPSFEASVNIIPGAIGGEVNAFSATTVTLGVNGAPALVDPSTPSAWAATTAYEVGDRVTISSGAVTLRALTDGTSDDTAPAAPGTHNVVIDATVAWLQTA